MQTILAKIKMVLEHFPKEQKLKHVVKVLLYDIIIPSSFLLTLPEIQLSWSYPETRELNSSPNLLEVNASLSLVKR